MVQSIVDTKMRWLGVQTLALGAHLLYSKFLTSGNSRPALKTEQVVARTLNELKPQAAPTPLVLNKVLPSAHTALQSVAGVAAAAIPLLGTPTGVAPAAAGTTTASAFTGAYTAASTAAKFAWNYLPWGTTLGAVGVLGLAYLAYNRYCKGSGVNITNTNTNTNTTTVHINLVGYDAKTTEVVKTDDGKGTVSVTLTQKKDPRFPEVVKRVIADTRSNQQVLTV